ncbi:hypothetical protein ONZ45_g13096 [Pleurotus djamor]|nr:hypothetical protein ONZ45_g13096 [Pleurotus djamor]
MDEIAGPSKQQETIETATAIAVQSSSDGRRLYAKKIEVIPPQPPAKRLRADATPSDASNILPMPTLPPDDSSLILDDELWLKTTPASEEQPNKRYASSASLARHHLDLEWMPFRDEYLLEMIRLDGTGDAVLLACSICKESVSNPYRCCDCFSRRLLCQNCCLSAHSENPLHVIQQWNSSFFERVPLGAAGLQVQLGHYPGTICTHPLTVEEFTILHVNGIHSITVKFCNCDRRSEHGTNRQQLLRRGWFPATFEQPRTCATFALLDHFQSQTLQSKVTAYDYYSALQLLTDNSGLMKIPARYKEFLRMNREYVHLNALKRGGRAHDPTGIPGTKNGELTVICPACPISGVNLPFDWESVPEDRRFLYTLFLALDACFRLKRRVVSSLEKDPGLGTDWGYFVEGEPFRKYLVSVTDQKEMSTCSGFAALDYANTKFSRGYAATGVCLAVCARHEFIQPNGAADLQVGERYANMDYVFASALRHHSPSLKLVVSYDIACQWSKSVVERVKNLPPLVRLQLVTSMVRFAVPKLHIHSHTKKCQQVFSLNYLPGVGRTDGEGIERPWANIGAVATSIRVMGPGARVETLNNHWSHWNWQKLKSLGSLLSKRLKAALLEKAIQEASFKIFSVKQGSRVQEWRQMVETFENDPSKPNPYVVPTTSASEYNVRSQHVCEAADAAARHSAQPHGSSPSKFIALGLDIINKQDHIKSLAKKSSGINTDASLGELRTQLAESLTRFHALQAFFLPSAPLPIAPSHNIQAESVPVILPSSLSTADRSGCRNDLIDIERSLCETLCQSSLDELRNQLVIKARLLSYKDRHARHQGPNTRTRAIIDRTQSKIKHQTSLFRASWLALKALADGDTSKLKWPELTDGAIRCLTDPDVRDPHQVRAARQGERGRADVITVGGTEEDEEDNEPLRAIVAKEGYRLVSWIWQDAVGSCVDDVLRTEWAKAWARARRWNEEVLLLKEEMRRTIITLRHQAAAWKGRVSCSHQPRFDYTSGLKAYAFRQASLRHDLASKFETMWKNACDDSDSADLDLIEDKAAAGGPDPTD